MATDNTRAPPQPISRADVRMVRGIVMDSGIAPPDSDDITQEVLCALAFHPKPAEAPAGSAPARARAQLLRRTIARKIIQHRCHLGRLRLGDRLFAQALAPPPAPDAEALLLLHAEIDTFRRVREKLKATDPALARMLDLLACDVPVPVAAAMLRIPPRTALAWLLRAGGVVRALKRSEVGARHRIR